MSCLRREHHAQTYAQNVGHDWPERGKLTGGDEEAEHGRGQGSLQARRQHRAEGGRHALLFPERRALGVPRKQLRVEATALLLGSMMREPCFNTLRTKQQLGEAL